MAALFLQIASLVLLRSPFVTAWTFPRHLRSSTETRLCAKGFDKNTHYPLDNNPSIYSLPALYDIAFGYRDYNEEVDFLFHAHKKVTGSNPSRILELAAGPARHALTALRQRTTTCCVHCIDLSPEMKQYALELASEELINDSLRSKFHYHVQDMRSFELTDADGLMDSAWILLGSLQHLTDNQDIIQCFQCIHKVLASNGTVIIELPHPRETFAMVDLTRNGWTVPLDNDDDKKAGSLDIVWGDENDEFDSIRQIRQFTVAMELKGVDSDETLFGDDKSTSLRQVVPMRLFTAQELDALARCAGFVVVDMYGALEKGVSVHDEDEAFRMVCVLQKQSDV